MGIYKHYIIIGGGGDAEIPNKLCVYDVSDRSSLSSNILKKLTCEELTGDGVPNHIETAMNINVLAVCMGENVVIYKLDPKQGKLEQL